VAGILLALLVRIVNGVGARRRAGAAARSLREQVDEVAEELVAAPVAAELDTYVRLCDALRRARGTAGRRSFLRRT